MLGQVVDGRYRIAARLARGGMATVYRATDLRLDRPVAVKILHPHLAEGARFVDRFRREARAAARLVDPGIVSVHDQGAWGDSPYLVMELVDGPNLRTLLLTSGLPSVGKALDLMIQVLQALSVAHTAGFVHRDIKPENILITRSGQVKVADFGLARAVSEVTAASSGVVLGTVAYLSPELIAEGVADKRADVYAAGVVLFELLTGAQPYVAETPIQVAFQHVHADFPAPSSRIGWLPAEIDALVAALTAKQPERRPEDAAAALALLRAVRRVLPAWVADRTPGVSLAPRPSDLDFPQLPDADAPDPAPGPPAALPDPPAESPGFAAPPAPAGALAGSPDRADSPADSPGFDAPPAPPAPPAPANALPESPGWAQAAAAGRDLATEAVPTGLPGGGTGGTQALPLARIPPPAPAAPTRRTRPRRRHRALAWLLGALLVAGGGAGGTLYWYFEHGPGSLVTVPRLAGLEQSEAEAELTRLGLEARVASEFDDAVAEGHVIGAAPDQGQRVDPGATIDLVVSLGVRQATVPSSGIVGQSAAHAKSELIAAGLDGDVTEKLTYDTFVAEGIVIEIQPRGGASVPHHLPITLVVSQGPEPVEAPDLTELTLEAAGEEAAGLELTVVQGEEAYSETVAEGLIVSQSPAPGAPSHRGAEISVVISLGMPFVEVPKVTSLPVDDAVALLQERGLAAEEYSPLGKFLGLVQAQDPAPGESVRKGSTVTLTVV
jgi:serine/threonine-protein kinase